MKNKANNKKESSKKRRPHGDGSLYKRIDGRWAGVSIYVDWSTGKKKKNFVYGNTRSEAAQKKKVWEDQYRQGLVATGTDQTVEEFMKMCLEVYFKPFVRPNTLDGYRYATNAHIIPTLGRYKVRDLRPEHLQRFVNDKLDHGNIRTGGPLRPRMVEYLLVIIHMALQIAVENGLAVRNVCNAVKKPKKVKPEFIPWTIEQTFHFLETVTESRFYPLYLIACGTGLRRSELLGLMWDDIDLDEGSISVRRTYVRFKGGFNFGPPKTKSSQRTVYVPPQIIRELKALKKRQAEEKLAFPGQYNTNNLVFCSEMGEPINPERVTRTFQADLLTAGLPHIRFHDLRHGYATSLLEKGVDIAKICAVMGHSTISTTADIYATVREKPKREIAAIMADILPA